MDYTELTINPKTEELSEIITAELAEFPFESFQTEKRRGELVLKGYIPQEQLADCKEDVDEMLEGYGIIERRYISIETQNWNAQWESNFDPVEIEGKLLIRAPFHEPNEAFGLEVVIMPKMSFGTGHHSTTHLMSEWIVDLGREGVISGRKVLDMGSGTGVLSIVAAKCGATAVDAVDIDEWADENCRENVGVNGVEGVVTPLLGDFSVVEGRQYGVILANINRNILLANMSRFSAALSADGELLMSGFLEQDIEAIRSGAEVHGLTFEAVRTDGGWVAMRVKK
ncbi:MAG: 50S ribosomal protein L11 methyltransferase [Rikenellaceae bacterium]